jgi:hypothetical protein
MLLLSLIVLSLTLPFLDKPVHIDDTFVLHIADRVLDHPADPFGGEFNWFGHLDPVWSTTTNPPLVSYWLAPVIALFGKNEIWLHLAMVPFYLFFGWGMFLVARRFTDEPWMPTLFLVGSAPFLVSGNLMRDIPAAGLALLGLALFLEGVDGSTRGEVLAGSVLLGFAVLAKYSVGVILPVAALYTLLRRRPLWVFWLSVSAAILGAWCLFTWVVYGQIHPLYLLLNRVSDSGIQWPDKFLSALAILGSAIYLSPLVVWAFGLTRSWKALALTSVSALLVVWWGYRFYDSDWDTGFSVWLVLGVILLAAALHSAAEDNWSADSLFLVAWLGSHVAFATFFVPFDAVRHILVAIPPLLLLLFRWLERHRAELHRVGVVAGALLVVQLGTALLVQGADYEYAGTYRDFAENIAPRFQADAKVWYVGQWGWKFYADQAALTMMNRDGPFPDSGDLLVWPGKVHIGDAFAGAAGMRKRLELLESFVYPGSIPIRTMDMESRAGFYAVIRRRIPYRFDGRPPLEVIRVFRVMPAQPGEEN